MQIRLNQFLLIALLGIFFVEAIAQAPLIVPERKGDFIHIVAPGLHFLSGKPMEKLRNGSSITYLMTLAAYTGTTRKPVAAMKETFVVSYDLWEERYSVVQSGSGGHSASRLTSASAESWCFENIRIPLRAIPNQRPFMLRFECSVEEDKENADGMDHSPLTLTGLIEVFGRKKSEAPFHIEAVGGPFRTADLKK
jgi:hypothetical protein